MIINIKENPNWNLKLKLYFLEFFQINAQRSNKDKVSIPKEFIPEDCPIRLQLRIGITIPYLVVCKDEVANFYRFI